MEIEDLWRLIDGHTNPLTDEVVPLLEALGRAVASDVRAARDFPSFDHSAMDGYAFREPNPGNCLIAGQIAAGDSPPSEIQRGQALRVLTGAPIPAGIFAVARQEDCVVVGGMVSVREPGRLDKGQHIRTRGAIAQAGSTVLYKGEIVRPGTIAFLTSCGLGDVRVFQRPRVLHIATGSELLATGESPLPGKIPDSNGPMIEALLAKDGIPCKRWKLRDDFAALFEAAQAFEDDLLLISGGSGPGDHDHTRKALDKAGFHVLGDHVNSRPGKPLIFAVRGKQAAFGLPGNPLSHWVCHQAFVRRALARMQGMPSPVLAETLCTHWAGAGGDGRRTWTPAKIVVDRGRVVAEPIPWLHSGDISPLLVADALLLDAPDPATKHVKTVLL